MIIRFRFRSWVESPWQQEVKLIRNFSSVAIGKIAIKCFIRYVLTFKGKFLSKLLLKFVWNLKGKVLFCAEVVPLNGVKERARGIKKLRFKLFSGQYGNISSKSKRIYGIKWHINPAESKYGFRSLTTLLDPMSNSFLFQTIKRALWSLQL